jgi:hypothetical protein
MSEPTYRELTTNFELWCKFVVLEEQVSEREFNEMSIDEKLDNALSTSVFLLLPIFSLDSLKYSRV